ncbi:diaminopimelate decarboxylase [Desulfovibrio litoralis]|uniref:Diaminopimelate decarboxylase n=1 Tax=Desulfovibrio litoralis DSM 11393 TaxID=1121455 RepID=A0A1M7SPZ9_9BACT|nr:diaminopimelate decarboxylase [Desulfovibrio litoralis]SHN60581.1 diaminopimelate decarboxylase [Desulfovibrio litoralis DSM 11393]
MQSLFAPYTDSIDFFKGHNPFDLIKKYLSPLYVYNEDVLRTRCRDFKNLSKDSKFTVSYSSKANSNPFLLNIMREEGIDVDVMSPGELCTALAAGYTKEHISYVSNNISSEEMLLGTKNCKIIGLDSLAQLEMFGKVSPNSKVMLRFNPGIGAGHHKKVITAGKETKFGVNPDELPDVQDILKEYNLQLTGINQHIGSLFMEPSSYLQAVEWLLDFAEQLDLKQLEIIDFGGGFGIPYHKHASEPRLDLKQTGEKLDSLLTSFRKKTGYNGSFMIEPGRYIPAESGLVLGTVYSTKQNAETTFVGTDIGFNILARPMLYDAYHEIEVFRENYDKEEAVEFIPQTITGNICESGDILAKMRNLPEINEGDLVALLDAGAYGFSMSSNYNMRLRPAELLITSSGKLELIRKRQSITDLFNSIEIKNPSKDLTTLLNTVIS